MRWLIEQDGNCTHIITTEQRIGYLLKK